MRLAAYTLGCKVNSYETSAIVQMFRERGYEIVDFEDIADVYLINTCSVTNQSDVKSRNRIRQANKRNKDAVIVAMGCYSQLNSTNVLKMDGVDLVIGTNNRHKIPELVEEIFANKKKINIVSDSKEIKEFENLMATEFEHTRAYLKIQDGCNNFCSYCIIPYARGRMRSRDPLDVLKECQKITQMGYKEIVLAGIHTGGYGVDINYPFSKLIAEILRNTPSLERLRISSIEINQIDEELLEIMKSDKRLCHHLHLPIQSASDNVLKDMNRHYTVIEYIKKIEYIRSIIPNIAITTDIIIGYPTETEEDFLETLANINKINFAYMHIFPFSRRSGTKAFQYPELNGLIVKDRIKRISEANIVNANKYAALFENKELDYIPESYKNGFLIGHTSNYLNVKCVGNQELIGKKVHIVVEKCGFPQNIGRII